jgi:hypothetical protein
MGFSSMMRMGLLLAAALFDGHARACGKMDHPGGGKMRRLRQIARRVGGMPTRRAVATVLQHEAVEGISLIPGGFRNEKDFTGVTLILEGKMQQ